MNLLLITRKVDAKDAKMSFIINWILEFSKKLNGGKLLIICQEKGEIPSFSSNIELYSMGKERDYKRWRQFVTFQWYLAKCVPMVDGVFAHMIQHYSIMAGPWCWVFRRPLFQWYMHKSVNIWLRLANFFVSGFVTASPESFRLSTKRPVYIFGHGIDTKKFKVEKRQTDQIASNSDSKFTILSVGRISPVKNIHLIVQAIEKLCDKDNNFKHKIILQIIGGPGLETHEKYFTKIINYIHDHNLSQIIYMLGPAPNSETLRYYKNCNLFINLSETGSLDKVVLEAMACEKMVLTSNESFKRILPENLFLSTSDPDILAEKIFSVYSMSQDDRKKVGKKLRNIVVTNHNLKNLIEKIMRLYEK